MRTITPPFLRFVPELKFTEQKEKYFSLRFSEEEVLRSSMVVAEAAPYETNFFRLDLENIFYLPISCFSDFQRYLNKHPHFHGPLPALYQAGSLL
jgi:hypothetical protein